MTRWYHCTSRCVRRAFLLGEGTSDRKLWIDNRLRMSKGRLFGRFFAAARQRLRDVAERLRLKRVPNLAGCPAS